MTRYFFILISASVFVSLFFGRASAWEGVVIKVIDGDSIQVQRDGNIHEIRLYGIDAPEYRQPYSNRAKQFTRRLAYRKVVDVEEKDLDRYGRIVAVVKSDDRVINRELVNAGLAWYYPKYCRQQPLCGELQLLEKSARREHRGLWMDKDPVAPWDWKRERKGRVSEGRSGWFSQFLKWLQP